MRKGKTKVFSVLPKPKDNTLSPFLLRLKHKRLSSTLLLPLNLMQAQTQGVFARSDRKWFYRGYYGGGVLTHKQNGTMNVSIRRTNRRLQKVNRVLSRRAHTIILLPTDTFVSFFGCSFTIAELAITEIFREQESILEVVTQQLPQTQGVFEADT